MRRLEAEYVVVGTGPGGATVSRELARRGRKVAMIERGKDWQRPIGRLSSLRTITHITRSIEGGIMGRGITTGGSSVVFNGNAYDPPTWLPDECGIDLTEEARETKREIGIKPLPEDFYRGWKGTLRLVQAAGDLDVHLAPQDKFIDPALCRNTCDDCMLGCRHGAKWTARNYIKEALQNGATLLTETTVTRVITGNGRAKGLEVRDKNGVSEIMADKVILSAGGIGTPVILLNSGIKNAGEGFFIDPMNVCMGVSRDGGTTGEMTFSFASDEFVETQGFLVSNVGGRTVFGAQLVRKGSRYKSILNLMRYKGFMGMFTKIGDTPGGRIFPDGKISKPYNAEDREKFRQGTELCKKILIGAGCKPSSITVAEDIGGHPGGAAAIGRVVGKNLESDVGGLYVCDASVFPRSPGRPPTLTIISLAKWFAKRIC